MQGGPEDHDKGSGPSEDGIQTDTHPGVQPHQALDRAVDGCTSVGSSVPGSLVSSRQCWKSGARARLSTLSGVEGLPDLSAALHPASRLGRRRDLIESLFNLLGTPSSYSGQC